MSPRGMRLARSLGGNVDIQPALDAPAQCEEIREQLVIHEGYGNFVSYDIGFRGNMMFNPKMYRVVDH